MTTDRGRTHALDRLVDLQEAGGYKLPAGLIDAHALPGRVRAVPPPEPAAYDVADAALEILHTLERGDRPDPAALAERVRCAATAGTDSDLAKRVTAAALERAQEAAINCAAATADAIIADCLRPVYDETLEQVRRHSGALAGHALEPRALVVAPAKVRSSWSALNDCAGRYKLLREARNLVSVAGLRQAESDVQGMFAAFADPFVLTPGYSPGTSAAPPRIEFPDDGIELMLWLTGDAAGAKPWLPTVAEQDAAWAAVFGEGVLTRQRAHRDALAIGARI